MRNNVCVKSCNNLVGRRAYQKDCLACSDPNCIDCSFDPGICISCNAITATTEDNFTCNCNRIG